MRFLGRGVREGRVGRTGLLDQHPYKQTTRDVKLCWGWEAGKNAGCKTDTATPVDFTPVADVLVLTLRWLSHFRCPSWRDGASPACPWPRPWRVGRCRVAWAAPSHVTNWRRTDPSVWNVTSMTRASDQTAKTMSLVSLFFFFFFLNTHRLQSAFKLHQLTQSKLSV